jgi:hypothetical protein
MTTTTPTDEYSAPLGAVDAGILRFADGAGNVRIRTDRDMPELFRARFEGRVPAMETSGGEVTFSYRRGTGGPFGWRHSGGEIVLNAMIPWGIDVRGGVANLDADLTGIRLTSLEVRGGVSHLDVSLPDPYRDSIVRIGGGVSRLNLHRPVGAEIAVRVGGGAADIQLDGMRLGAVGGGIDWKSPQFDDADDRYEVQIGGGVSHISLDAR